MSSLKRLQPQPRAIAAPPGYPALLCAAITALAGCSAPLEDTADSGAADAAAEVDGHAFAEASVADATDDSGEDGMQLSGCSAAPYHAAPGSSWALGALALLLVRKRAAARPG